MIHFELESDGSLFEEALQFAQRQVGGIVKRYPDYYPMYTQEGRWKHDGPAWTHWCDGFLPGMMWIFCRRAGADSADGKYWKELAIRYSKPLEPRKFDRDAHDLGFIFMPTYHRWYHLNGDAALRTTLIQAGQTTALRFQEKGQYLSSFIDKNSLFIDLMMNVGLIFYAAREKGDRTLREIALRHSLTTLRVLVRGDGSTAQEGIFDTESGEFLRQSTQQGWRGDSCWSRGLAWAIYGFGTCYEYSRDPHFVRTAERCADYYITHTPGPGVPPWDFQAPKESRAHLDSSAAAIAAAGLLRLSRLLSDPVKGHFYWNTATHILRTLCKSYLARDGKKWEGVLRGGVYHFQRGLALDECTMWGDYYFTEALAHALRRL